MKKLLPVLLVLCLLLAACGPASSLKTPASSTPDSSNPTDTSGDPTPEPEPVVLYPHPLNGQPLETPWTGRATTVVINNLSKCLPQHGIGDADVLYEIEAEGGITRCLAVYSDLLSVGPIGPVRSARTFFNNISLSYDAPIAHCGGSVRGRNAGYEDSGKKIPNWEHLDQMYNGKYFYRDADRKGKYATEHTLFTTGEKLLQGLASKNFASTSETAPNYGLTFQEDVSLNGSPATTVVISFLGKKTTTMTYNTETGLYEATQYKQAWIDGNSDETIAFKNLMVLYTKQWKRHDGEYSRSYYDLIGSGQGLLAIDGKLVPINWARSDLNGSFSYTLADGSPVVLAPGHTYIAVASTSSNPATYQ